VAFKMPTNKQFFSNFFCFLLDVGTFTMITIH
jgi:hypothetical protein